MEPGGAFIANLALAACQHSQQIASLEEESSTARLCKLFIDQARHDVLTCGHEWSFATSRLVLTANASTPPDPWQYAYAMPPSSIKPLRLDDGRLQRLPEDAIPFAVAPTDDGNALQIFCQLSPATLVFVRDIANYGIWTPGARAAAAAQLAVYLIGPLKGKLEQQRYLREYADHELTKAMIDDHQRHADGPNVASPYEAARN